MVIKANLTGWKVPLLIAGPDDNVGRRVTNRHIARRILSYRRYTHHPLLHPCGLEADYSTLHAGCVSMLSPHGLDSLQRQEVPSLAFVHITYFCGVEPARLPTSITATTATLLALVRLALRAFHVPNLMHEAFLAYASMEVQRASHRP